MTTFLLEIITPERVVYQEQVDMVVAPAVKGIVGILAHHVPLFTSLKEGELKIVKGQEEYFLAIGGGFLEVTPDKVSILVTRALHAQEINEKEVLEAKARAEEALLQKPTGDSFLAAQSLLRRSLVDLKVLRRRQTKLPSSTAIPNV